MRAIKRLCLILSVILLFSVLSGCSNRQVELTTENYKQYLEIDINYKAYSALSAVLDMPDNAYDSLDVEGTVSGISGYTYENVTLTIEYIIDSDDYHQESIDNNGPYTSTVTLNVGGNGKISQSLAIGFFNKYSDFSYRVTNITGTVTKD